MDDQGAQYHLRLNPSPSQTPIILSAIVLLPNRCSINIGHAKVLTVRQQGSGAARGCPYQGVQKASLKLEVERSSFRSQGLKQMC